jgi:hypothetical protein
MTPLCVRRVLGVLACGCLALPPLPLDASDAVQQVTVSASLQSRTSLRVSSETLVFTVSPDGDSGTATLDYVASTRTRGDAEVVLAIEPVRGVVGPGGSADVETSMAFATDSGGGALGAPWPSSAARWIGSGSRAGRITFTLRAAAAGTYVVPVRLVLSTP